MVLGKSLLSRSGRALMGPQNPWTGISIRRQFSVMQRVTCLIMGPPGGGKGTIAKKLVSDFGFDHISSGDMLRAQVQKETQLGKEAKSFMEAGELVPDDLMVQLLLAEVGNHTTRVLLDGFPRTVYQAQKLEDQVPISLVLNLEVPNEEIVERISDRWVHLASGRVYSYGFQPPKEEGKDDITGEPLIRRADDEPEQIRHRLEIYQEKTFPLIEHYREMEVLESFSGADHPELLAKNRRSDAIYASLKPCVQKHLDELESTLSFSV